MANIEHFFALILPLKVLYIYIPLFFLWSAQLKNCSVKVFELLLEYINLIWQDIIWVGSFIPLPPPSHLHMHAYTCAHIHTLHM